MPIPVTCPDCLAALNIPERLAGETVKCPDCGIHVRVPGGAVTAPAGWADRPPPRRKDEEPDDRPRQRRPRPAEPADRPRRRRAGSGTQGAWVFLWVMVGLVVVAGVGVGVYFAARSSGKKPDAETANTGPPAVVTPDLPANPAAGGTRPRPAGTPGLSLTNLTRPPLPDGWVDFKHPRGDYSVYVPTQPRAYVDRDRFGPPSRPGGAPMFGNSVYMTAPSAKQPTCCAMVASTFPPEIIEQYRAGVIDPAAANGMFPGIAMTTTRITWAGKPATEMVVESDLGGMVAGLPGGAQLGQTVNSQGLPGKLATKNRSYIRYLVLNDKLQAFAIQNLYGPPSEAERKAFFDSVVFGK